MIKSYERIKKLNKEKIKVPKYVQDTIPVDTTNTQKVIVSWTSTIRLHQEKIKVTFFSVTVICSIHLTLPS